MGYKELREEYINKVFNYLTNQGHDSLSGSIVVELHPKGVTKEFSVESIVVPLMQTAMHAALDGKFEADQLTEDNFVNGLEQMVAFAMADAVYRCDSREELDKIKVNLNLEVKK